MTLIFQQKRDLSEDMQLLNRPVTESDYLEGFTIPDLSSLFDKTLSRCEICGRKFDNEYAISQHRNWHKKKL